MALPIIQEDTTCVDNLPRCGASCCKTFSLIIPPNTIIEKGKDYAFRPRPLTNDLRKYYEYHGCTVTRDEVITTVQDYALDGTRLLLYNRCSKLTTDLRCSLHNTRKKPRICSYLNWETRVSKRLHLTEGCAYKEERP